MNIRESIYKALEKVNDPELKKNLIELNMIKDVVIEDSKAIVTVNLTTKGCPLKSAIARDIKAEVQKVEGIDEVEVAFGEMTKEEKEKLAEKLQNKAGREEKFKNTRIIAIGSGKGGVGKSTVTANLAVVLAKMGYKVGLLDADILGYSIPQIMGIEGVKPRMAEGGLIMPIEKDGVKVISMGNLVEKNSAFIWRGPMLGRVLEQFLYDVCWGELEYLLIDLPPGTGDVPLSLMQTVRKAEIVIVTTPQITAASVAGRLGLMAEKTGSKVIGVIENMSYFVCSNCKEKHYIFGRGEGDLLSRDLNTKLMGEIPLVTAVREQADRGMMRFLDENPEIGDAYRKIAKNLVEQ